MGRQELLEYLLREIEKCGFEIFAVDIFPIPAAVNVDKKLMIYNFKEASPFEIAHELIHILNKDNHRGEYFDAINPQEVRANHEALLLLWEIFEANGGTYEYFNVFVDTTDAPFELAYSIISKEYSEMHDYIVDYISYFNVLESVNIYHFLDHYHLNYCLYELAEKEFQKIFKVA